MASAHVPWPYGDWIAEEVAQAAAAQPEVILLAAQSRIHSLEQRIRSLEAVQENERLQHGAPIGKHFCRLGDIFFVLSLVVGPFADLPFPLSLSLQTSPSIFAHISIFPEQLYHGLEERWQSAAALATQKEDSLRALQRSIEKQHADAQHASDAESSLREALRQQSNRVTQLQTQNESMEALQREHLAILEQRHRDLEQSRAQLERLNESDRVLRAEKQETERKLFQIQNELIQSQFQLNKSQTEHAEMVKAREWLEQQLATRTQQLSDAQSHSAQSESELRQRVATLQSELSLRDQRLTELEHSHTAAVADRAKFASQLTDAQQSLTQTQLQLEAKIEAQQRLIDLHSSKSEDAQRQCLEAQAKEEAMRQLATQLKEQHQATLLKDAERISSLQEQLDAALQDLALVRAQIAELTRSGSSDSPGLILTEDQLKAHIEKLVQMDSTGKKHLQMLISVQQKCETAEDALRAERLDKNRLVALLQQIAEDLAAKEPLVERNRRDYERAKAEQAQLSSSLEQSLAQNDQLRSQLDILHRESAQIQQENDDLSRQVSVLLKECQQLQNQSNQPSAPGVADPNPNLSDAMDVAADANTYTFRDIRDLQEKYRQLLRVVRELSQEEDNTTKQTTQQLLETALTELRQVSQARERQEEKLRQYLKLVEAQKTLIEDHETKYQQLSIQYQRLQAGSSADAIAAVAAPLPTAAPSQVGLNDASTRHN
jgi:hypothetical protein